MEIVYFSNYSGNTHRFVEKLDTPAKVHRIPIKWHDDEPLLVSEDYVLIVPTYGAGRGSYAVPKQVIKFLNIEQNRSHIKGIVGMGNTNFGNHYCLAAEIISYKTNVPIIYRVELMGTPDDVLNVTERMKDLWNSNMAIMN